jgi:hypothetical protein
VLHCGSVLQSRAHVVAAPDRIFRSIDIRIGTAASWRRDRHSPCALPIADA